MSMAKSRLKKLFRRIVATVFYMLLAGLAAGYLVLRTSLPVIDGEISVTGLDAEIEILREANGVPHIYAATETDSYFGRSEEHTSELQSQA